MQQQFLRVKSVYAIMILVQTENPKRVPSFRVFLYNPRMASMPLIVVEAVRKLRYNLIEQDHRPVKRRNKLFRYLMVRCSVP